MIVPIQDIQGLVFNEYIKFDNALKNLKNWGNIIVKLPDERKSYSRKAKGIRTSY
jgi:hypothetical protein